MKISLRQIEVFRSIMLAGSVTGAARLLFTSQPTVSRELARLELVSGLRLFDREGGRLLPTAQALMLLDEVERCYVGLERIDHYAQSIRNFEHGRLALTCLPLFSQTLLPKVCRRFYQAHAGISVSIVSQESPLLEESLVTQQHDLGLIEVHQVPRGTRGELLFSADLVCVLPPGHPLAAKTVLSLEDFHQIDFINLASLDIYRQTLDEHFRQAQVNRRTVIETGNAASVCAMVRQGLGVAIINPLTALAEAGRDLVIRSLNLSVPYRVMLIRPNHRPASVSVDAFCEVLREEAQLSVAGIKEAVSGNTNVAG
ncbi:LysR family transcriptional regulator [Pseudomonas frederiksbergensis]|uniref:LysR family transcriptional regulator n=1 Tax=Pseudomonas frederiksbergensis TaxID=104087 RepID=A0A423K838_9PSED|nr:LysR family transcriptional regulator [Pseudomonas frederiksbergensis]RON47943.1 LysR family transcriptional regulator [Pseudomonas frederiksbergensis]RON54468.1 LysR family transcriptional regulator [Pseudomonas frederiksbergensis]